MVKLEEIEDEAFTSEQLGPKDDENDWDTDSDTSSLSSSTSSPTDEPLSARLAALIDIIPPSTRARLSAASASLAAFAWAGTRLTGRVAWAVSTSALLLAVPFALVSQEEQMLLEEEKRQQLVGGMNEFVAPGAGAGTGGAAP